MEQSRGKTKLEVIWNVPCPNFWSLLAASHCSYDNITPSEKHDEKDVAEQESQMKDPTKAEFWQVPVLVLHRDSWVDILLLRMILLFLSFDESAYQYSINLKGQTSLFSTAYHRTSFRLRENWL